MRALRSLAAMTALACALGGLLVRAGAASAGPPPAGSSQAQGAASAGPPPAGSSQAQGAEPIALAWTSPDGCPDRAAIRARIEVLLGGPPAAAERRLSAKGVVSALARGYRLELTVASEGSESTRVLQSVSCESIADAGALVIALAFDPDAVTAQEIKRAEEAKAGGATPSEADPAGTPGENGAAGAPDGDPGAHDDHAGPVSTAGLVRIPVTIPPAASSSAPAPPAAADGGPSGPPAVDAPPALSFGGFAAFAGDAGSLPSIAPGVRAGLSLGIGAYRVRAAFEGWPSSKRSLQDRPLAGAEVRLLAFAADGCRRLLPWSDGGSVAAFGCVGLELGEMQGQGYGVSVPASGGALWAAPRMSLGAELSLARWVALTLDVGIAVPVDRRRFVLDLSEGREVVHTPSEVSGRAGLGLALRY
ncbi:MAG: hypothetical protein R3B70_20450 [Polyangiaceae bacterium]